MQRNSQEKEKKKKRDWDAEFLFSGRMPPSDIGFEEAILGGLCLEARSEQSLRGMAMLTPDIFYKDEHREVFLAIRELFVADMPVDIITVTDALKRRGKLEDIGGSYMIAKLTSKVSSTANIEYHISVLQQLSLKRKLIQGSIDAINEAFTPSSDVFKLYDQVQANLDGSFKDVIKSDTVSIDIVHESLIRESIKVLETGITSGLPSGLIMLDRVTNGWQKSDLVIIAGRPSMGKTSIALAFLANPAIKHKKPMAIFSLEMSRAQLTARIQSDLSGIDVSRIVKKQLSREEIMHIGMKCVDLETAPIYIDDTAAISLPQLKAKARRLKKEHKIEGIIIDYLQLMRSGLDIMHREQEVAEISKGLKALAKELDIPVIALSQLNRAVESRGGDKKPNLSDLRESGQIEQDADMVAFCYRPEYYGISQYEIDNEIFDTHGLFMLIIAKHRNGSVGELAFKFIHHQAKVTDHEIAFRAGLNEAPTPEPEAPHPPVTRSEPTEEKTGKSMYDLGKEMIEGGSDPNDIVPF